MPSTSACVRPRGQMRSRPALSQARDPQVPPAIAVNAAATAIVSCGPNAPRSNSTRVIGIERIARPAAAGSASPSATSSACDFACGDHLSILARRCWQRCGASVRRRSRSTRCRAEVHRAEWCSRATTTADDDGDATMAPTIRTNCGMPAASVPGIARERKRRTSR